jgi:uncharacterized damage-inducible protein DinB
MTIDEARELFAYGAWANGHVFAAAEGLAEGEVGAAAPSSFPSVLATLGHLVGAEWIWLRRFCGESPAAAPAWASGSSLAELKARLTALEAERTEYLGRLSDADLRRVVAYRTLSGDAHAEPLEDLVRHVVNHSTYHRGQAATQLRQLGRTPPNTDLIAYLRQAR